MIPQNFIDEVQSRTDIVELIAGYIPLKRTGRNFKALCPFHGEKTPSFVISPQKQIFHCFGCGEGGGVFQFLMFMEKITFPEAIEVLAQKVNLEIPYQRGKSVKDKSFLYEAMGRAVDFYHQKLKTDKDLGPIRQYLAKRFISVETIDTFKLGYAPGSNALMDYMRKAGYTLEALERTALVSAGKFGFRDAFRSRITFPIFDSRSRVVAFGARSISKDPNSPKYINSLEGVLYSKRNHLYGLHLAKDQIIKAEYAIVVEGYLDMIVPYSAGVGNIVASLGTALTDEQIRLLKRYTNRVVLMYDSDPAGQMATMRSIGLLLESGLRAEVVRMPKGYDPDSLITEKGKKYFSRLLSERCDFFDYKLAVLKESHDASSIEGKTKIAKDILATISKLNSEIEKYEYIKKLASSLDVGEEIMIAEFRTNFSKVSGSQGEGNFSRSLSSGGSRKVTSVTEKVVLKFMFTGGQALSIIKKNLKEDCFDSYLARKTASFFFNSFLQGQDYSIQKLLGTIKDKEISGLISKILMDDDIPLDKDIFKESLLKLRKKGTMQMKKNLQKSIKEAESKGDKVRLRELIEEYSKLK